MNPARRWLEKQKEAFFKLSPSEQQLAAVEGTPSSPETPTAPARPAGLSTAGLPKGFFKPYFMVKYIRPEGPAASAGLLDEDLIVSFGDVPVRDLAPLKYHAMLASAANNDAAIPVVVVRAEQEVQLLLKPLRDGKLGCELERYQPGQVRR
ncbi:hypothetical protein C8F01DRAFT_1113408 [Mycena amicta]|nr:hypothetical protein C8F01DRAFT_1113408 [Mycena amicta]